MAKLWVRALAHVGLADAEQQAGEGEVARVAVVEELHLLQVRADCGW